MDFRTVEDGPTDNLIQHLASTSLLDKIVGPALMQVQGQMEDSGLGSPSLDCCKPAQLRAA